MATATNQLLAATMETNLRRIRHPARRVLNRKVCQRMSMKNREACLITLKIRQSSLKTTMDSLRLWLGHSQGFRASNLERVPTQKRVQATNGSLLRLPLAASRLPWRFLCSQPILYLISNPNLQLISLLRKRIIKRRMRAMAVLMKTTRRKKKIQKNKKGRSLQMQALKLKPQPSHLLPVTGCLKQTW